MRQINICQYNESRLMSKDLISPTGDISQHLISCYKIEVVENGRLLSPSSLPELTSLDISLR